MTTTNEIYKNFNNIKVCVSPYIELLGVVFVLCDFSLNVPRKNDKYIEKIINHFSAFKNHKLIVEFSSLLKINTFKYDAPVELILNIETNTTPTIELLSRAHIDLKQYETLKELVLDFYKTSNFEEFFKSQSKYYLDNIESFISTILKYSPSNYLFDFLNLNANNLKIVLMHGVTTSNYGINVANTLHCMVRPYRLSRFDGVDFAYNLPYITSLILHEFAHSFINPLTDKYLDENKINKQILKSIMDNHSYGSHYKTAINESIIRAIECMYIDSLFPNESYEFKQEYIVEGFTLIDKLIEYYMVYKSNKTETQTIEDYYQDILNIFYK